jgi:hypothetical protein
VLHFGQADDYIDIGDHPLYNFDAATGFTLAFWQRSSGASTAAFSEAWAWKYQAPGFRVIVTKASNDIEATVHDGTNYRRAFYTSNRLDGQWHHVAWSLRRHPNATQLYWDGVPVSPSHDDTGFASLGSLANTALLTWGGSIASNATDFAGYMDDLRIYGRALTAQEIQGLVQDPWLEFRWAWERTQRRYWKPGLIPQPPAITGSEAVAELASSTNATSYALEAFTPAAEAVLVVLVFATGTVAAGTMSGGSLTWTRATSVAYNSGVDTAYVFWATTGASPGSTTITFHCTGDTATGCVLMAFQFTHADVSTPTPIRQVKTGTGSGANPAVTFDSALLPANGYCAGFGIPRNPPASTTPFEWTEVADTGYSTPTAGATGAFRVRHESGATITFTSASGAWGMVAVEVWGAGQGPIVGQPMMRRWGGVRHGRYYGAKNVGVF